MQKVDRKEVAATNKIIDSHEKNDSETNHQQFNEEINKIHRKDRTHQYDTYEIDHKTLPFLFRFNYAALQRLKIKKGPNVPQLAIDIFDYLQEKLVVRRYSEGGKFPNRMKYEEKVKFLMRAFDHRRGSFATQALKKKEKFNRQKQLQFFTRPEVRKHFFAEINHALVRKKAENDRRIRDVQDCLDVALQFARSAPEKGYVIFQQRIKRKQLPWTDNMFQDIEEFSKQLYYRFSAENIEAEKAAILKMNSSPLSKQEEWEESIEDSDVVSQKSPLKELRQSKEEQSS